MAGQKSAACRARPAVFGNNGRPSWLTASWHGAHVSKCSATCRESIPSDSPSASAIAETRIASHSRSLFMMHSFELFAQTPPSVVEPAHDRSQRNLQQLGQLGIRQPVEVLQCDNLAILGSQRPQGLLEVG